MKKLLLILPLLFSACATPPPPKPAPVLTAADYGPPPQGYRETVAKYLLITLKDPFSVRNLVISEPSKIRYVSLAGKTYVGWRVCFTYYAKNSYGAYNGEDVDQIIFKDGKPIFVGS